jgi:glycine hydroxymethyltransferase
VCSQAAVAVALKEAMHPTYAKYMHAVRANARALSAALKKAGYDVVTHGTDNHIVLWNARSTRLSGAKIEKLLEAVDISVNKNTLVSDVSAFNPGGVRLGTLAMTTRGMNAKDMRQIADFITRVVQIGQEIEAAARQEEVADAVTSVGSPQVPKAVKLKVFLEVAHREDFASKLAQIKDEVNAVATRFSLPGRKPALPM